MVEALAASAKSMTELSEVTFKVHINDVQWSVVSSHLVRCIFPRLWVLGFRPVRIRGNVVKFCSDIMQCGRSFVLLRAPYLIGVTPTDVNGLLGVLSGFHELALLG
jgi:hypothetical protein